MQTVAIVGVGLIGGSFALALRKAGFQGRILGVSSTETARKALDAGVIDESVPLPHACQSADVLYLAHRISRILELIPEIGKYAHPGLLVTDAGSTKGRICAAAAEVLPRQAFLGGHPMAGKEVRGVEGSDASLFKGRTYILTPIDENDLESGAQQEFTEWIRRIGARVVVMKPEEHDRTVAFTSHLPQLLSTVLAQTVSRNLSPANAAGAAGPGLHDMTRLALSSYDIWQDIIDTNSTEIENAIRKFVGLLDGLSLLGTGTIENAFSEGERLATCIRRPVRTDPPSKNT